MRKLGSALKIHLLTFYCCSVVHSVNKLGVCGCMRAFRHALRNLSPMVFFIFVEASDKHVCVFADECLCSYMHCTACVLSLQTNPWTSHARTFNSESQDYALSPQPQWLNLLGNISAMFDTAKLGPVVFAPLP